MKRNLVGLVICLFVGAIMLVACSSEKGPAELAIKAAEEVFNSVKTEAVKYAPEEVKSLEGALASVKDKFAKGEYKGVISEAQSLASKAKGLLDSVKAKKVELTKSWNELNQGVPKMMESLQSRVDILSKSKKLPANITAQKLDEVKNSFATAKDEWAKALESFKAGNLAEATTMAKSVKDKAVEAMKALGMTVPAAAKQ